MSHVWELTKRDSWEHCFMTPRSKKALCDEYRTNYRPQKDTMLCHFCYALLAARKSPTTPKDGLLGMGSEEKEDG